MDNFLGQIILAARNSDAENWMNILFVVAIVIFYAIGSIVKAKANKSKGEQGEERPGRRPVLEPSEGIREGDKAVQKRAYEQAQRPPGRPLNKIQPHPQAQPARREVGRPRPAVQKLATKTEQDLLLEDLELQEIQKLSVPRPQLQPILKELPDLTSKPIEKLEAKQLGIPARKDQAPPAVKRLLDFEEPDELRKAILHYEILGKPLSLRQPSDRIF